LKNPASVLCPIGAGFAGPFLALAPPPGPPEAGIAGVGAFGFDVVVDLGFEVADAGLLLVVAASVSVSEPEHVSSV